MYCMYSLRLEHTSGSRSYSLSFQQPRTVATMSKTKVLMLLLEVVTVTVPFLGTCAAPYLPLRTQVISAGWPTNSFPVFMAPHSDAILPPQPHTNGVYYVLNTESAAGVKKSDLPSSDKYVYPSILNTTSLRLDGMSDLPSGGTLRKSTITGTTADKYTLRPTLGDAIALIPFLPIEINVPNVVSSVMEFFNWMIRRRPQDQSTPRIYFLLRNHHGYRLYPLSVWPALSVPPEDNHPSYGGLMGRLVNPVYSKPTA